MLVVIAIFGGFVLTVRTRSWKLSEDTDFSFSYSRISFIYLLFIHNRSSRTELDSSARTSFLFVGFKICSVLKRKIKRNCGIMLCLVQT